jgi:transglutaminase-like putative cysteine protease
VRAASVARLPVVQVSTTKRQSLGRAVALALVLGASPAGARSAEAVVHEPIPPDAREDLAMHVALAGDIPGAIETRSGIVPAPDPLRAPSSHETAYGGDASSKIYMPDRDTRRPDVAAYDDPFTPSTAPFKRLQAFDSVGADYQLRVADERLTPMPVRGVAQPQDDVFYADLVVSFAAGNRARIPSVGPGARILRASLGDGVDVVPFRALHDGADNWFLEAPAARAGLRGRLVMELSIPRASLGGPYADVAWDRLPAVPPLPPNVAQDAVQVRDAIGVSRAMRPREALARMVNYFRGFEVSDEPPTGHGSVYLDLALTKKGVCRHRSFAFLVTALSLGMPARFVMNDTHAWVEVSDGALWKRIDLGGAGRMASKDRSEEEAPAYDAPSDAFPWPKAGERGEDMVRESRAGGGSSPSTRAASAPAGPSAAPSAAATTAGNKAGSDHDRGGNATTVMLSAVEAAPHRGQPLHVSGEVRSDSQVCPHAAVEVWLTNPKTQERVRLGTLATGDDGKFSGSIVVPASLALGTYDVSAQTPKDERCAGW